MSLGDIIDKILPTRTLKTAVICACAAIVGLGALSAYLLRIHTYLGDDPAACVNCHIMAPYHATWLHSSHGRDATCNDCHVPHDSFVRKYWFKATDGLRHTAMFVTHSEHQVIRANDGSAEVIMDNCIRCHTQLNQEFVKTGRVDFMIAQTGEGKACWDCHREIPHGNNSLSTVPKAAQVPYPDSPVPQWLNHAKNK